MSVLAVRPAAVPFGGRSILPWAMIDARTRTALTVHNVGPAPLAFRILFFHPNGSPAGRSGPRVLPAHATENLDLREFAGRSRIGWSRGAMHVQWASRGLTRVSPAATQSIVFDDGTGPFARELALDDYGPAPLSSADLQDILGE